MKGKWTLYIDQYGNKIGASTLKELIKKVRERIGGGRVYKMYVDKKDGSVCHVGYVIGDHWFNAYQPVEIKQ